jgi:signal transduction histidine kinase
MVSHDLRRPLTRLLGFCEFLVEGGLSPEEIQEAIAIIDSAGKEMNQIISDLMRLALIKQQDVSWESINLSEIAKDIVHKLQLNEPERQVDIFFEDNLPVVGDRRLLKLALENLLENAWKYTSRKPQAKIEFFQRDDRVFVIRDNGAGFDMTNQEEIFAPFKRLHQDTDFTGTGIGLAIVERIIQSHQGKIWCEAVKDEGASFFFTINI